MRDDDIAVLIFFLLFYGVPGIVATWLVGQSVWVRRRINRGTGLARIAGLLGGEVARDPSAAAPFVRMQLPCGRAYFLFLRPWGFLMERVVSTVEIRLGNPGFLEATSRRSKRILSRGPRLTEIRPFHDFRIVTGDPAWAARLLDGGLQTFLNDAQRLFRRPIRLQLSPGRTTLEVEARLSPKQAVALVREAERLAQWLRGGDAGAGIEFLQEGFDASASVCPVCRREASSIVVLCRGCRAPHHADCWSYTGRCAILGCGSQAVA